MRIDIIILRHFLYLLMSRPTTIYAGTIYIRAIFISIFTMINHISMMIVLYNDLVFGAQYCLMIAFVV